MQYLWRVLFKKRLFRIKKGASITRIDFLGCTLSRETFASFHEKRRKRKESARGGRVTGLTCFFPQVFSTLLMPGSNR